MWNNIRRRCLTLLLSLAMIITYMPLSMMTAYAAAGDVPDHAKILQMNDDGTYTIALNVKGDSEKDPQKVNIIVIVDRSNSMNEDSGTGAYVASNTNGATMYGFIDGEYRLLTRNYVAGSWVYYYDGTQYTGQRYIYDTNASRIEATRAAVNGLASTLLSYNGKDGNDDDTVEMALVDFATAARTRVASTTDATTFINAVNSTSPPGGNAGGTNWEMALRQADTISFGDSDPTYVIFFSDGAPTFYGTGPSGTGGETEPNMSNSYNASTDEAAALATKVGVERFYTIFAYGSTAGRTYMTNLTAAAGAPASNNYSASNTVELEEAFAKILEAIELAGIGAVDITDGTTSTVERASGGVSHLLTVDESSYKYYRAGGIADGGGEKYDSDANTITDTKGTTTNIGEVWEDAPPAEFKDGSVEWDLSSEGVLENDVTYTVTFDCWPSQETLDIVADIKNNPSSYDDLDTNIKKYITRDGNLATNTTASISYVDTRTGESNEENYINPPDVTTTAVEQLAVSKEWENVLDEEEADEITLTVTSDGSDHHTMTLSDPSWSAGTYISIGILRHAEDGKYTDSEGEKFEVLETGHDFTFKEPKDLGYYWELQVPTVRPMLVDGTLTMLILKEGIYNNPEKTTEYTIDGKTYYEGDTEAASLTAVNHRRAQLNLTKVVDGEDADPDQEFPFTLNVVDSKASEGSADNHDSDYYVWFSVYNGGFVDALVSGAEKEIGEDGEWTGYYYAPSGTDIEVNLKAGDNLRFLNLPVGSTYTFTEGTLPENYAWTSSELTARTWDDTGKEITIKPEDADSTFSGAQTTTGTIEITNADITVTYTNTYDLTDIEITKVWEDNGDQDGIRPTADEFKSYLVLKADGTDVTTANASKLTVTDNGDDTYTAKWTGLNRFADGDEIAYTVEETTIKGYTTTGSPASDKGEITNTHTPETTEVTVVKVWEDSNNIGKIRPASINVQLTADGTAEGAVQALNADNKWTYTWENLPKYKDGEEIVYSADETAVPAGYDKTGPTKTTAQDGTVTFTVTNTYNPTPVSVDPPVQKVITGTDDLYNGGDFTFTIEAVSPSDAPMPANTEITNSAAYELEDKEGFYEFGEITFTTPGEYTYKITESGEVDGVTNDPDAEDGKTLTFTVTDDGEGNLVVSPTTDQVQLAFTNVYDADGEASIVVSKEITGAAWPAGKSLTLTIAGANGAPMPETTTATLNAAGSVTFGPIAYGLSDAGKSYEYTITESSFGAGWSGSPASIKATVAVIDNGDGSLGTTVTYSPTDAKFTNTYTATGTAVIEATKAIEGAAWPEDGEITFTLAGTENAPMPARGGETATLTEPGTATFGTINYTEADAGKTYNYTITEDGFGTGWTGSPGSITATVVVSDNGNGTLSTAVTYSPEDKTITNTYVAEGEAEIEVTKALEGAAWPAGKSLTFTLAGEEGAPMPAEGGEEVTLTAAGTAAFGTIAYDESDAGKTYEYTITEGSFGDGWTGSPGSITATVEVTDNGDGTLATDITYDPANKTFTNTYDAEGEATIEVTKAISGAAWPTGKSLTFTLAGRGNAPMPEEGGEEVTLTAAGKATFGTIAYDESDIGQTYSYTITEGSFGDGWTGTPNSITATVEVTDNGDGTLDTTVTYSPEDATFTNTYDAEGEAVIEVNKVISGAAWPSGKTITFTLAGTGGTLPETKTVSLSAPGKAAFDAITYDESDIGKTYTYTITENGFGTGWSGSPQSITATVVVRDNGNGTLGTTVTYSPENATFTNTYAAEGSAVIKATKQLTGRAWKDGESYDFTLYGPDGSEIETKQVTQNGEISFTAIQYDESDAGKEYTYTISETTNPLPPGVTKSGDIKATVTVTDAGDGTLSTAVTYSPEDATIVNTYTALPVNAQIKVDKTITGYKSDDDAVQGEFKMILTPVGDAPMPEGAETLETTVTTTGGEGSGVFDAITYDEVGEYTYEVTEEAGSRAGMSYDSNTYTVTVKVTDNPDKGILEAEVVYSSSSSEGGEGESATSVEVTNDFQIDPVEVTLSVTKLIEDLSESAGDATFKFDLKNADKEVIQSKEIQTSGSTGGSVDFDALTFTKDGTYTYYIQENVETEEDGWTYDTKEYSVQIVISDNLTEAKLVKDSVAYDGTKTKLEITNIYQAEPYTVSDITVNKTIEDTSGSAYETTFTFTLTGKDGAPMPENNKASVTGEGSVTFEGIEYTKVGTYEYTVKEEAADAKGYIYDTTEYSVTVTVTDEGGHLVADVSYGEDESGTPKTAIDIINTYDPEDAKIILKATKIVEDKVGSAPDEEFKFELVDPEGKVVETVTRTNGGPVEFSELTFDKVGTYAYKIREVAGSTPGYTYDTAERTVTVTVTDPGDGLLVATAEGNDPEIENPYEVPPGEKSVTDDIEITKTLTGRDLEEGEFTFVLESVDGETILTATNDADGKVAFAPITFDKVGEYTFTVWEVTGDLEDVTYDTSVYTVVATVTDPHTGDALEVKWSCSEGDEIEFINDYEPPEEHKKKKPDTGDTNDLEGMLGLMGASAAGLLYMFFRRRREDYL